MLNMSQSPFVKCMDCSFITTTQGYLGIHRSKMHNIEVPDHIKIVSIVRPFPEVKPYYCCLCNNIIGSFPNFKRHFQNIHKGISLNVSAICLICDRSFPKSSGAGVHVQWKHIIGKDDSYPASPSPAMSYVDLEDPANNTTIAPSGRSCRLRNKSPLTTPLSMSRRLSRRVFSSTSTIENNHTNSTTSTPLQPITPISHTSSPSYPNPVLLDLDLEDDLDTSLPPRPIASIPNHHHQVLLEPVVALIDCTAGNRIALTSTQINPSNPIHQLSPESMVALNGRTNGDGDVLPNQTSNPTVTFPPSLNPDALDFEPTQPSSLPHPPDTNPPAANTPPHPDQFTVPSSSDSQSLNASKDTSNDETSQFNKKWSSTFAANSS